VKARGQLYVESASEFLAEHLVHLRSSLARVVGDDRMIQASDLPAHVANIELSLVHASSVSGRRVTRVT
jgi:hypothetical protein